MEEEYTKFNGIPDGQRRYQPGGKGQNKLYETHRFGYSGTHGLKRKRETDITKQMHESAYVDQRGMGAFPYKIPTLNEADAQAIMSLPRGGIIPTVVEGGESEETINTPGVVVAQAQPEVPQENIPERNRAQLQQQQQMAEQMAQQLQMNGKGHEKQMMDLKREHEEKLKAAGILASNKQYELEQQLEAEKRNGIDPMEIDQKESSLPTNHEKETRQEIGGICMVPNPYCPGKIQSVEGLPLKEWTDKAAKELKKKLEEIAKAKQDAIDKQHKMDNEKKLAIGSAANPIVIPSEKSGDIVPRETFKQFSNGAGHHINNDSSFEDLQKFYGLLLKFKTIPSEKDEYDTLKKRLEDLLIYHKNINMAEIEDDRLERDDNPKKKKLDNSKEEKKRSSKTKNEIKDLANRERREIELQRERERLGAENRAQVEKAEKVVKEKAEKTKNILLPKKMETRAEKEKRTDVPSQHTRRAEAPTITNETLQTVLSKHSGVRRLDKLEAKMKDLHEIFLQAEGEVKSKIEKEIDILKPRIAKLK